MTTDESITLRCPTCGLTNNKSKRDQSDPPAATIIETQCPKCVGSNFSFVKYFDAEGKQVFQCDHQWIKQRMGGDPTSESSEESVVVCKICGEEKSEI